MLAEARDPSQVALRVRVLHLDPARHTEDDGLGALELIGQALEPQLGAQPRPQRRLIERLAQEIVRARLERMQSALGVTGARAQGRRSLDSGSRSSRGSG